VAERVRVREIDDDEGCRLVRIVRFSTWSLSKLAEFLVAEAVVDTSAMRACACCSVRRRHLMSG